MSARNFGFVFCVVLLLVSVTNTLFLTQSDTVSLSYPSESFIVIGDVLFYTFYSNVSFLNFHPCRLLDQSGFFVCLYLFLL